VGGIVGQEGSAAGFSDFAPFAWCLAPSHPNGTLPPSECCTIQSSGLVTISFRLSLRCALGAF